MQVPRRRPRFGPRIPFEELLFKFHVKLRVPEGTQPLLGDGSGLWLHFRTPGRGGRGGEARNLGSTGLKGTYQNLPSTFWRALHLKGHSFGFQNSHLERIQHTPSFGYPLLIGLRSSHAPYNGPPRLVLKPLTEMGVALEGLQQLPG